MDLKTYIHHLDADALEQFARSVDSSVGHLRNISSGQRQAGEALCIAIDKATRGGVACEELRPDVDWAYLRGTRKRKQPAEA